MTASRYRRRHAPPIEREGGLALVSTYNDRKLVWRPVMVPGWSKSEPEPKDHVLSFDFHVDSSVHDSLDKPLREARASLHGFESRAAMAFFCGFLDEIKDRCIES